MTTILSSGGFDRTDRDFVAMVRRITQLMQAKFPTWTNHVRAALGSLLKEAVCYVGDQIGYYLDRAAKEARWSSATQRKSIIEGAALVGYSLDGATAAQATVRFTVTGATADVTLPAGTLVVTEDLVSPVTFQLLVEQTITFGGAGYVDATVENSLPQEDVVTAAGEQDEKIELTATPFLEASETVTVDGISWTRVDNFVDSDDDDTHYTIKVDDDNRATITFGDGRNGLFPSSGALIDVDYKTGGGEIGNVEAGTITKIQGTFADDLGQQVTVTVNNAAAVSVEGANRETVDQAKVRVPAFIQTLSRCVSREDYENLAIQVSGVGRALALTSNEDATVPDGWVYLYIVPDGGGAPTGVLKTAVEDYINNNYPTSLIVSWETRDAIYVNISVKVWVYLDNVDESDTVVTRIRSALDAYFSPVVAETLTPNRNIDFGYYYKDQDGVTDGLLSWSKIANMIEDLDGIRRLGTPDDTKGFQLNDNMDDISLLVREFPQLQYTTIYNGDTGAVIFTNVP